MKHFIGNLLVLTFLSIPPLKAQQLNFQGVARNSSGTVLANQAIKVRLSIRDANALGTVQYTETRTVTTSAYGSFKIVIGSSGALSTTGSMAAVTWAAAPKFLQVEVDPLNGNTFTDLGTTEMVTVPTAVYASTAGTAAPGGNAGGDLTGTYPSPVVNKIQGRTISTTAPLSGQVLKFNGTNWSPAADDNSGIGWSLNGNNLFNSNSGNVGIGTNSPTGPLSFSNSGGNKIVLQGDGSQAHFGIGVNSGILQFYTASNTSSIGLGSGNSFNFNERVRILNSGPDGMLINGRVTLLNGTSPNNPAFGAGLWLRHPNNSVDIAFMGVQNENNVGFFGGTVGWGLTYNTVTSRVGIGNNNPNAPLSFAPTLEKKITLYPGATGDVGFGVSGNRLQIYADNPNADVAIGYDAAGTFNERFAVKANGTIAVNGNIGATGQILTSNGNGQPAAFQSLGSIMKVVSATPSRIQGDVTVSASYSSPAELTPITLTVTIPAGQNAILLVSSEIHMIFQGCTGLGCVAGAYVRLSINGQLTNNELYFDASSGNRDHAIFANYPLSVGPGTHTIRFMASKGGSVDTNAYTAKCIYSSILVIPQ